MDKHINLYINVKREVCMHVCVFDIDSQMAKGILMKICRHDPWVPTKVFYPNKFQRCHP